MLAVVIAEGVAIVLLGLLVAGLLRSHAEILRGLHQLGVDLDPDSGRQQGRPISAPTRIAADQHAFDIAGERLDGSAVGLGVVGTDHHTLLAFLSSTCATCRPFWSALAAGARAPLDARVVVVAETGDDRARLAELAGPTVDVVLSGEAWRDYQVPGSPHLVFVDGPTGRVAGEGTGSSWEQVCDLLMHANGADPQRARRDNAERIDTELAAAGIGPGHASLYPQPPQESLRSPAATSAVSADGTDGR